MAEQKQAPIEDTYKEVRGQIEHLNNNLGQRVIWLVIAQSFFFSGYAILINGKPPDQNLMPVHDSMIKIIPIAALLTVIFTYLDVIASLIQMKKLRENFESGEGSSRIKDIHYPPINGNRKQRIFVHTSPMLMPIIFVVCWIILIVKQYAGG